jgi:DNA-binding NarL/FixJ family response regulator
MLKLTSNGTQPALCNATPPARDTSWQSEWMEKPVQVVAVVVEKRPLIRDLITHCLSRVAGFAVAAASSIDECATISRENPTIVIVSISGSPNSEANKALLNKTAETIPGVPIVVLSDGEDLSNVMSALSQGTRGYISTDMSLDVAIEALSLVRAGGQFVPASCIIGMGHAAAGAPVDHLQSSLSNILTARQTAVVKALCQGKANKIIAYELKMKESTVKVHVRNIMKKLKAKNRTEVAYITNQLVLHGAP